MHNSVNKEKPTEASDKNKIKSDITADQSKII